MPDRRAAPIMSIIEVFLTGIGLSMDAFAAAVCRGLQMKGRIVKTQMLIIALLFGGFQALMPAIGYLLGSQFEQYIKAVDHWIAFGLLLFIGGKMVVDVIRSRLASEGCSCEDKEEPFSVGSVVLMALATSIDALAVGISFACLEVQIVPACLLIGCTTFVLSLVGVWLGHRFGNKYEAAATLSGGMILIIIGTKILIEHLFFA